MADSFELAGDAALLAATARGDREAFAVFYRRHLSAVVAFLVRETGDRELAGDLAGEVFCAALLGCGRYRAEHSSSLPWLCGIARNKVSESRRRGRAEDRARRALGVPRESLTDEDLERVDELAELGSGVLGLLQELPAAQRQAVEARVLEERSYQEIAASSGSSEPAVRQNVSRALTWLRERARSERS
jgi:RNA polymerase sigma factor (sigma-70 family)